MRRKLSKLERRILRSITEAPVAWQSVQDLSDLSGLTLDETNDVLALLDTDGWIAVWEPEGTLAITLTALGAARLRVELTEAGQSGVQRWIDRDKAARTPIRSRMAKGGDADFSLLEIIADPAPPPDIAAELAEQNISTSDPDEKPRAKVKEHLLPRPTILLGVGYTPWPGAPKPGKSQTCPVCASKPLHPRAYCLWCDRWGLDALLFGKPSNPGATGAAGPKHYPKRTRPDQAQIEREMRKDRRKRKHDERWTRAAQSTTKREQVRG